MTRPRTITGAALLIAFLSELAAGQPTITQVVPATASPGMPIVISGSGFSPVPSQNLVTVNGVVAAVRNPTAPGAIVAIIPAAATSGLVEVTVEGQVASSPSSIAIVPDAGFSNLLQVQADAGFQTLDYSVVDNTLPLMKIELDSSITSLVSGSYGVYAVIDNITAPVNVTASFPLSGSPLGVVTSGEIPAGVTTLVVTGTAGTGETFSFAGSMLTFDATTKYIGAPADGDKSSVSPDPETGVNYQLELLDVGFESGASLAVIRDLLATHGVTPVGLTLDQTLAPPIPLTLYVDVRLSGTPILSLRDNLRSAPEIASASLNLMNELAAVRPVGEQMPTRLIGGGPRPAYNSMGTNAAYTAANGGFDQNGSTVAGPPVVGIDELDILYPHFFYQTFAAQRLQSYVYANVAHAGGGAAPARPMLAVVDSGFGNGGATAAAGNLVLNDLPLARLGMTDPDGLAFNGVRAETGAVTINAPVMVMGGLVAAAGDSRVPVTGITDQLANSHGTFVALLAAAGGAIFQGQTPTSTVIPYRVMTAGGAIPANAINAALNDIGTNANRANVAVINYSIGAGPLANAGVAAGTAPNPAYPAAALGALNAVAAANQILVVAAANCGVNANLFRPQTLADAQFANPLVRPLMIDVAATDIRPPLAGVGPVGPEQSWRATAVPGAGCPASAGCAFQGTNFGNQISVSAYGGQWFTAINRAGTMRFTCGGTSWAAPQVAGLLTELVHLDRWVGGAPGGAVAARRRQVVEYVLGSADDLGSTTAAAPFINNDAGNGPTRAGDAPDPNFGYGRVNSWKATLSVLNRGLARQFGRTAIGGGGANANNDSVHRNLALMNDGATVWYGFEVITSVNGATAWIDGTLLNDQGGGGDPGASVPANGAPASASRIFAFKGVRSDMQLDRGVQHQSDGSAPDPLIAGPPQRLGLVTDADPLTGVVAVGTRVNNRGQYILTFSIRREDLYQGGNAKTLSLRLPGQTGAIKPFYNLRLETAKMRGEGGAFVSGVTFDDFVFTITVPDYGDSPVGPVGMGGEVPDSENGPRHHNTALEWLGRSGASNDKSVTGEVNADVQALGGDPTVDADGVINLHPHYQDRDGRDDGVIFFPLSYVPGNTGKVQFTISVADATDIFALGPPISGRYSPTAPDADPDRSLFFNLWIDWDADGNFEETNSEHPLNGIQITPAGGWRVLGNQPGSGTVNNPAAADVSADGNSATFTCSNLPVGVIECGHIWARARIDYGEDVGRNDPTPVFQSLPSLRALAGGAASLARGAARYGEVEDYFVGADFGDAPDAPYPTLLASVGAYHLHTAKEWLGSENCCGPFATRETDADDDNIWCGGLDPLFWGGDQDGVANLFPEDSDEHDDGFDVVGCTPCGAAFSFDVTVASSIGSRGSANIPLFGGIVDFPADAGDSLPRYSAFDSKRRLYLSGWADWDGSGTWENDEKIIDEIVDPWSFGTDGQYTLGEEFLDFNGNGVYDTGDFYFDLFGAESKTFTYTVFPDTSPPTLPQRVWCRLRLSYGEDDDLVHLDTAEADADNRALGDATGGALFGEVEDFTIFTPDSCGFPRVVSEGNHDFDTTPARFDGPVAGCGGTGRDMWFAYEATCTGTATIDTQPTGFNTVLDVYDGDDCPPTMLLQCNDDEPFFNGPTSYVQINVSGGSRYLIRVAGKANADRGAGVLRISCKPTGPVLFVNQNVAGGTGSGDSWANACQRLETALQFAAQSAVDGQPPNVEEIWVATGIYTPTPGLDRAKTLTLVPGVEVYGGFVGAEALRTQRNPVANVTILSGDLAGNDAGGFTNIADNSYHVVTSLGADAWVNVGRYTVLDGFVLFGGNADGAGGLHSDRGGNMFVQVGGPYVSHCTFQDGSARYGGGGLYTNEFGTPVVSWCTFASNRSTDDCGNCGGGAIYAEDDGTRPYVANCDIYENVCAADPVSGQGGGCGGGLTLRNHSVGGVVNCHIHDNNAVAGGGVCTAIGTTLPQQASIVNCTIRDNTATNQGGGVYVYRADTIFHNNIIWDNAAAAGPQMTVVCPAAPFVAFCDVQGGAAAVQVIGGCGLPNYNGVNNRNVNPLFGAGGHILPGSPCIDAGNQALRLVDAADLNDDGNVAELVPLDLDAAPRVALVNVDMGAFEVQNNANPVGACCIGQTCTLTTQGACGGLWMGAGAPCDPNPCLNVPGNDDCPQAPLLPIPSSTIGDTTLASADPAAPFCGTPVTAPGLWYSVIGTGTQVTVSLCGAPTTYDAKLNVYTGGCGSLNCVAGVDDFCGLRPQVSWCASSGQQYRILVQGFNGAVGPFEMVITQDSQPCSGPCQGVRGDANCSGGSPDFFDIDPFLEALFDLPGYLSTYCGGSICAADIDCSGSVDFFDIDPLLQCLFSSCPPCP